MLLACLLSSCIFGLAPSAGGSAAAGQEATPISLEEALRLGEQHSPLVRRARAETTVVGARDVGASLILPSNPVAAVVAGPRRESGGPSGSEQGIQYVGRLEQTVEVAGQRGMRRAAVRKALDVASAREALALSESRARIRSVYMTGLITAAQARAARGRETIVNQLFEAVKVKVEKGAASQVDVKLAEIEAGRLMRERVAADLAAVESVTTLAALIGLPPRTQVSLTTPLGGPNVHLPPQSQLFAQAQAHRAELRELAAAGTELDAELMLLRREAIPSPTLILELERDLPGQLFVGAGLALPLPAWRRNQGERALTSANKDRVAEEWRLQDREIALQVEHAIQRVIATYEQAKILETTVAPAAEASANLLTDGWRAGKFDLFRVIQASREVGEARRAQLEAIREFWQAVIELDRATGAI
jgi:cobalt-zinc-cadmium efflux system outer membrane protein